MDDSFFTSGNNELHKMSPLKGKTVISMELLESAFSNAKKELIDYLKDINYPRHIIDKLVENSYERNWPESIRTEELRIKNMEKIKYVCWDENYELKDAGFFSKKIIGVLNIFAKIVGDTPSHVLKTLPRKPGPGEHPLLPVHADIRFVVILKKFNKHLSEKFIGDDFGFILFFVT